MLRLFVTKNVVVEMNKIDNAVTNRNFENFTKVLEAATMASPLLQS